MSTQDNQKNYWLNLAEAAPQSEGAAPGSDEFSEMLDTQEMDGPNRRHFMGIMGASVAMAGFAGCARRPEELILPYTRMPEDVLPGEPNHYATVMNIGGDVIGLLVESNDGRPTKVEGNPTHGWTAGGTNSAAQASVLDLYDPARLRAPRKNKSPADWAAADTFVKAHFAGYAKTSGKGLVILSEAIPSPSLDRLRKRIKARFPLSRWMTYESISHDNERAGLNAAFGKPLRAVNWLDRVRVVLALDSDFLDGEANAVANVKRWSQRRDPDANQGQMNRLYCVEAVHSLTGSNADHRLRLRHDEVEALAFQVAQELTNHGLVLSADLRDAIKTRSAGLSDKAKKFARAVADDLVARSPSVGDVKDGLVIAGRRQPPIVHNLAAAMNHFLSGAAHGASTYFPDISRAEEEGGDMENIRALTELLNAGKVETLVVLGGNPVYNAPGDLKFGAAFAKAKTSICLSDYPDETSKGATWAIPRAHFMEAWGDLIASNGTLAVQQPLIAPLHGAWSEIEMLARVLGDEPTDGYSLVNRYFKQTYSGDGYETYWRKWLHDGQIPMPALGSLPSHARHQGGGSLLANQAKKTEASPTSLDVVFVADPNLHDGRYANNSWLLEAPDPMSKLSWENAAFIGPATARALGIDPPSMLGKPFAERVTIEADGRKVDMIAWIVPGIAENTVVLPMGYGRNFDGYLPYHEKGIVGFDVNPLRSSTSPNILRGATMTRRGGQYPVACVQRFGQLEPGFEYGARSMVRETDVEGYRNDPRFAVEGIIAHGENGAVIPKKDIDGKKIDYVVAHPPEKALHADPAKGADFSTGMQWGMVIDLNKCTGCNNCLVACVAENNIPSVGKDEVRNGREMHWMRMDRYFSGDGDEPQVVHQPLGCVHCEMAPCENVCPVQATAHGPEGTNDMAYNRCIGTRYCANNCPYKVRRFNFYNYTAQSSWWNGFKVRDDAVVDAAKDNELTHMVRNPDVTVRFRGVMEKCTYCIQRINRGKRKAKLARTAVEMLQAIESISPACGQACSSDAISFGDINNERSEVSKKRAINRNYRPLSELNVRPRTSYLARVRNPNPDLEKKG